MKLHKLIPFMLTIGLLIANTALARPSHHHHSGGNRNHHSYHHYNHRPRYRPVYVRPAFIRPVYYGYFPRPYYGGYYGLYYGRGLYMPPNGNYTGVPYPLNRVYPYGPSLENP